MLAAEGIAARPKHRGNCDSRFSGPTQRIDPYTPTVLLPAFFLKSWYSCRSPAPHSTHLISRAGNAAAEWDMTSQRTRRQTLKSIAGSFWSLRPRSVVWTWMGRDALAPASGSTPDPVSGSYPPSAWRHPLNPGQMLERFLQTLCPTASRFNGNTAAVEFRQSRIAFPDYGSAFDQPGCRQS
jgi:hypothetical protein